jgi:hypothetical protein
MCCRQLAGGVVRPHTQLWQGATVNLNTNIELLDNSYRETKELQGKGGRGRDKERGREGKREREGLGEYVFEYQCVQVSNSIIHII